MTTPRQPDLLPAHEFLRRHTATERVPGKVYLHLYHGRNHPDERLDDWGFSGPTLGPVQFFHTTYAATLCIKFEDGSEYLCHTSKDPMYLHDDLLCCDGKYYGDWTVYVA